MNKIKKTWNTALIRANTALSAPKTQKTATMLFTFIIAAMMASSLCFASDDITKGITTGMSKVYSIMTAVVTPIAAVIFVFSAFKLLFGGEKGVESAKKMMIITVVVLLLVFFGPVIVEQVQGWFKGTVGTKGSEHGGRTGGVFANADA